MKRAILYFILFCIGCAPALFWPAPQSPTELLAHKTTYHQVASRPQEQLPFISMGVGVNRASGGICHYDSVNNVAYVITCAHIFDKPYRGKYWIRTFYANGHFHRWSFKGKVLAINEYEDLALLSFKPTFVPNFVPIGPKSSPYAWPTRAPEGKKVIVVGRDAGSDPKLHVAYIRKPIKGDWYLESRQGISHGGRSGAPVLTEDGRWIVAVNHGRFDSDYGVGHGAWVPLHRIHRFLKKVGYEWIAHTEGSAIPNSIPLYTPDGLRKLPSRYIPLPAWPFFLLPLSWLCVARESTLSKI